MTSITVDNTEEDTEEMRFAFGKNWRNFLKILNDTRILEAEKSLKEMLNVGSLAGKNVLDIESGSGLFSLVARRLGAHVTSFDYDTNSVACTKELKKRYFSDNTDKEWRVEQGSVLDVGCLKSLKRFDIVYSWGVLHHTGDMYQALWVLKVFIVDCVGLKNPLTRYLNKTKSRGMSVWYDIVDWLGGYPYEVAKPEDIFDFYTKRSFQLIRMKTVGRGHGCNEFVFQYHPDKSEDKIKCAD